MTARKASSNPRKLCSALLVGTILGGLSAPAAGQQPATGQGTTGTPPAPATQVEGVVRSISVVGNQRLEAETVLSYMRLRVGQPYNRERLDEALRDLYATELFADVQIRDNGGALTVEVRENPVINRVIIEGNRRLKTDKITPEIKLAPRQIFTRSRVRADVARIIELYRRQGRFAARVEPKIIQLEQNRVDVVFEIDEGPLSKVRAINIIGNERFSDSRLRDEMATRQAGGLLGFLQSNDTYDPDRLAYDQQKLRQFYLTEGYADFRVVSAVAELTPDRRDFIITYVVEEGERYRFGDVKVESEIRDFRSEDLSRSLPMRSGDWFNAKQVEDTVTLLNEQAGLFGYAFADVRPQYERNPETRTMDLTFRIGDAPRVYVERIEINGNTNTRDEVIRREFRLAEGDPFNSVRVKRSRDRIESLGFFQEGLEIEQEQGSAPDRVVLSVDVEERSTGELNFAAGFSSLERFLINASIRQRNFMGKGQELRASLNYSTYARSFELGFTEPYLFDRNIAVGFDVYRRDMRSFNFVNEERNTTYEQVTTGGQVRAGLPLTEYLSLALRYALNRDEITLDEDLFFTDPDDDGVATCDPLLAGRYLCEAIGRRTSSTLGYSLVYDTLNNRLRPTRGERAVINQDFAGLGGSVRYLRNRVSGAKYWDIGKGFILSTQLEGGYIHSFEKERFDAFGNPLERVRLTDRFFLGDPQIRGFDIRGIGPRVRRIPIGSDGEPATDEKQFVDDPLGGRMYYLGRAEVQIPLGAQARELGLRPSAFIDVGALWGLEDVVTQRNINCINGTEVTPLPDDQTQCPEGFTIAAGSFIERYLGDTPKPRISVGIGVNWNSPFGPFRIDIAKALTKAEGDNTKLFSFNVGTPF